MMNDNDGVIEAFISITNCSKEVATNYLIATNYNLDVAIDLYLNSDHTTNFNINNYHHNTDKDIHNNINHAKLNYELPTTSSGEYYDVDHSTLHTMDSNKNKHILTKYNNNNNKNHNYDIREPDKVKRQRLVETYIG